jgi:S-adenosylmethionine:diacylglycerol 3-amino-3-carboxypropyl transferase
MSALFDFGISQEDPLSEQRALDIKSYDRLLMIASGGEVPLSLLSLNENIQIKAVDISENQIKLCRLKLHTALQLDFPINGCFLGYAKLDMVKRKELYREKIRPVLSKEDIAFWDQNVSFIENGIINAGRFEQYIRKMRFVVNLFIGRKNLLQLIESSSLEEQKKIFAEKIASRKSLQLLFKIAFHPAIYKKRGLQEQALIHAGKTTGEQFYSKFQNFCTSGLASNNYFLQYFLTENCSKSESFPEYLQPQNKNRLLNNLNNLELKIISLQDELSVKEKGFFNKVHLSNIGDWLTEEQFFTLLELLKLKCETGTKLCVRYLQKNHFLNSKTQEFVIDKELSSSIEKSDRFPFYTIFSIMI